MNIEQFCDKHKDLSEAQINMAKAMLMMNAAENDVLKVIKNLRTNTNIPKASNDLTCPHCGGLMKIVTLADDRRAKYCDKDRVALPLPKEKKK